MDTLCTFFVCPIRLPCGGEPADRQFSWTRRCLMAAISLLCSPRHWVLRITQDRTGPLTASPAASPQPHSLMPMFQQAAAAATPFGGNTTVVQPHEREALIAQHLQLRMQQAAASITESSQPANQISFDKLMENSVFYKGSRRSSHTWRFARPDGARYRMRQKRH